MLEKRLIVTLMQLETNLNPNITTRPKGNTGERKSKTPLPKQIKVVKLSIFR
jgi:hypothetical protein